ncbi:MAG: hypothetical protein WC734_04365 [Patescibacteria group bacterium]|jgi:hypothetical protein
MSQPTELAQSILEELAYFDIFDFPLTPIELWRYSRIEGAAIADIYQSLGSDPWLADRIGERHGFWHLAGRSEIVESRLRRYRESEAKYQKALTYIKRLSHFPFIRMIGVCNSLAYSNSRREADIDLFIVTQPGWIWTSRMYATSYLRLLRQRPYDRRSTVDAICPSFYITEDNLNLASLRRGQPDIYLAHWVWQLMPLYDSGDTYRKFISANGWTRTIFPNAYHSQPTETRRVANGTPAQRIKTLIESGHKNALGRRWEKWNERFQRRVLPRQLKDLANVDSRVMLSDQILKFHENDRRDEYQRRWVDSVSALR